MLWSQTSEEVRSCSLRLAARPLTGYSLGLSAASRCFGRKLPRKFAPVRCAWRRGRSPDIRWVFQQPLDALVANFRGSSLLFAAPGGAAAHRIFVGSFSSLLTVGHYVGLLLTEGWCEATPDS